MAPKGKKGGKTAPEESSTPTLELPRDQLEKRKNPRTTQPLKQRYLPNPINLDGLPEWDEDLIKSEAFWEVGVEKGGEEESGSRGFVNHTAKFTIPKQLQRSSEVVWKRCKDFMDLGVDETAGDAPPADTKKKDAKKDDKKKGGGVGEASIKVWEERVVDEVTKKVLPQVLKLSSATPSADSLLPPAPILPTTTADRAGEGAGAEEATGGGDGENTEGDEGTPSPPTAKSQATLPEPDITLPVIKADPTPRSTTMNTIRSTNKFDFLKSFTPDQIKQIRDSEVMAEEARVAYEREKELKEQETARLKEEKEKAEGSEGISPEEETPKGGESEGGGGDGGVGGEVEPELPQPIQKSTLNREGGEVDSVMASIFRCLSNFVGSFSSAPEPPAVNAETGEVEGAVSPSKTPFLWEAIHPQDKRGKPVYNPDGKYAVKVFVGGKWRMLEINDSMPLGAYDEPLILSSGKEGEIWPMILSKACYYLWDVTGARIKSDSVINNSSSDELRENASFAAFCMSVLTGWLPQTTTTSPSLSDLRDSGVLESNANEFLVHIPSVEDDAALPQRDSPQKKLAQILSPNKKKKKRKAKKPPPPHPISVEEALRNSHNRIVEIRESMLGAKPGESVVVFYDSLHNLQILPILAIGHIDESESPLLLLSWDCEQPTCPPYNSKNVIPHLPIPPTPQMLWMTVDDLAQADCRVVNMSTFNGVQEVSNLQFTLPLPAGEYVNVDDRVAGEEEGSGEGEEEKKKDLVDEGYRRPINLAPTLLHVDVEGIQKKRLTPDGPPRLVIAGPPAGGKGTQCANIVEKYGVVHLSTGDMLRAAVAAESEVGLKAKECMEAGELVPDDVITNVVLERLKEEDCQSKGWLLDGFPRTEAQAESLNAATKEEGSSILPVDAFILLEVPSETLVERVVGRRSDPETGKIYHMKFNPPEDEEIANRLVQRADDTEEAIVVRIEAFNANTAGVLGKFDERVIKKIDGSGQVEEIGQSVLVSIEDLVNPAEVSAKLHVCLSCNSHDASASESANEGVLEFVDAEQPEVTGPVEEQPSVALSERSVVFAQDSEVAPPTEAWKTNLAEVCDCTRLTLTDYYDASVQHTVVVDATDSLNLRDIVIPNVSPSGSSLFVVKLESPFGATVTAHCSTKVTIGEADELFSGKVGGAVASSKGSTPAQFAGDYNVMFRKVLNFETETEMNCNLFVDDPILSDFVELALLEEGGRERRACGLSFEKTLVKGKVTFVGSVSSKVCDLPRFDWKITCLSEKSGGDFADENVDIRSHFGGVYTPNKYLRFFRDVLTVPFGVQEEGGEEGAQKNKNSPLTLRFFCGDGGLFCRFRVFSEDGETLLFDGRGKNGIVCGSLVEVENVATKGGAGGEGDGDGDGDGGGDGEGEEKKEGENDTAEKTCRRFIVEAIIDEERCVVPEELRSIRPYYFAPTVKARKDDSAAAGDEGEVEIASGIPAVEGAGEEDLLWYLNITSAEPIYLSNDMKQLNLFQKLRSGWEEADPGRSKRADVIRAQFLAKKESGGKGRGLKLLEKDEDGSWVDPTAEEEKGKKGKGKGKKGEEKGTEGGGGEVLTRDEETKEFDLTLLMNVAERAKALKIDVVNECKREVVRAEVLHAVENRKIGEKGVEDGVVLISRDDIAQRGKQIDEAIKLNDEKIDGLKEGLTKGLERSLHELEEQKRIITLQRREELEVKMSALADEREDYRLQVLKREADFVAKHTAERDTVEAEKDRVAKENIEAEKEFAKNKKAKK